ncbi:MAG: L-fucose mutarotase [Bacteroidetes bacterium B1(2017)]|nr:MAG: L-fucose mutarotase [Bacteroidetes bacterium B1(2017)]
MNTYYLALDLKNDAELIAEYEAYHKAVWPEVLEQIKATGILSCDIYRVHNRLVMVLVTEPTFSFSAKAHADANHAKVQEWETLMWNYQQAIPGSGPTEKWQLMEKIFSL